MYQGQEADHKIKGEGNSINYKYRMHDPRLGRFFAVDPLAPEYPHNSTYAFSENRVIDAIELEGLEMIIIHGTWASRKDVKIHKIHVADYKGGSTWDNAIGFVQSVAHLAGWNDNQTYEYEWTGYNKKWARRKAAKMLVKELTNLESNPDAENKHATLLGHSHGGNVGKIAKKCLKKRGGV